MNFHNGNGNGDDYGFSVERSNPFRVFPILQKIAAEHVGRESMIDLSRGDPGYGFAPGVRAREFLSFLLFLDAKLNNTGHLFIQTKHEQESVILEEIAGFARSAYVPAIAERYLRDLSEFIQKSIMIGREQGLEWSVYDVLYEIFKCSTVSGGTYHDPKGELLVRAIVAWWHRRSLETPVDYNDVIFTSGASHAIGTLFKMLGQEGIQYLNPGDKVLISSPVYSPYNTIMERRGIDVVGVSVDPDSGKISEKSLSALGKLKGVKAVLIIDPNNPTGFALEEKARVALAEFAKKQDALVITDEVYAQFFENHKSMMDLCPERTVRIQARSKIERSTGLRFGDIVIGKEANEYLTKHLFKKLLPEGQDFKTTFMFAKGPGGIHGEFQHTTFVTGPAQILGAAHILLGEEEREVYKEWTLNNMEIFCEALGVPYAGSRYYMIFDMNEVPGCKKRDVSPEQKIVELAKQGVIMLPANLFFSEEDRDVKNRSNAIRVSLVNSSPENVKRAADIIRNYLTS